MGGGRPHRAGRARFRRGSGGSTDAVRLALSKRGALVVVRDLAEAFAIANQIAPEHLELEIQNPERWIGEVHSAGAVFVGSMSPAPLGDYVAGPNHVLPTGGAARFAS